MWIRKLDLRFAPGVPDGLTLDALSPGLNVVVGPNASGKSTVGRALRGTIWPADLDEAVFAVSTWVTGDQERSASVVHRRTSWEPDSPVLPPREAAQQYAFGIAALLASSSADAELGRHLIVELAGGYDLDAARKAFPSSEQPSQANRRDLERGRTALRQAEGATDALADKDDELVSVRRDLTAARSAQSRVRLAEQALELVHARADVERRDQDLAAFPQGLERLRGDERKRLDDHAKDRAGLERDAAVLRVEIANLNVRLDELALPREPSIEELETWPRKATALVDLERRRDETAELLTEADRRAAQLRRSVLDASAHGGRELEPETLDRFELSLAEVRRCQSELDVARASVRTWSADAEPGETVTTSALQTSATILRAWLRTPPPAARGASKTWPWPSWLPLAVLATGLVVALLGAALVGGWGAAAGSLILGVGIALWVVVRVGSAQDVPAEADQRAGWEAQGRAQGVKLERWETATVEQALQQVEQRLVRRERQDLFVTEHVKATRLVSSASRKLEEAHASVEATRVALGLASSLSELALAQQARAVAAWIEASAAATGLRARHVDLERRVTDGLAALGAKLAPLLTQASPPADATAAATRVALLKTRVQALGDTRVRREDKEAELARLAGRIRAVDAAVTALLTDAGLDDDATVLDERLAQLEPWRACVRQVDTSRQRVERLTSELTAAGAEAALDVSLDDLDVGSITALVDELRTEAAAFEALSKREGALSSELRAARAGKTLEDARARLAEASASFALEREQATRDALARMVLEDARQAQLETGAPPVLDRARTWFGHFTHHAWRLEVDDGGAFCALHTGSGQRRSLDQLSDATRIQLLLAARLAALEAQETASGPLPLCLDEVLSTTDPARFREVGRALLELTHEGRQILYLTADPAEAMQWTQACSELGEAPPRVIDLGQARPTGVTLPSLALPKPTEVPAPDGDDVDGYARRLGVHPPDGHRPVDAWHLLYLVPDRLPQVHACLQRRIDCLGTWREARRHGTADLSIDPDVARLVDARADMLDAVLDGWRIGRGRPVTWDDVAGSKAVSPIFAERVQCELRDHGDDARAFVAAVGDLKGFRNASKDQLRQHLIETGALDERPRLSSDTIVQGALGRVREAITADVLTAPDAVAFAERTVGLLGGA